MDRTGNLITELLCKDRMKHTYLERLFSGRIENEAILCTDSHATKYLSNYLYWFKWLEFFNTEKDIIKSKNLTIQSHAAYSNTILKDFSIRDAIYI